MIPQFEAMENIMSTRATYEFNSNGVSNFVYIHHDGYMSGAANYFRKMMNSVGEGITYYNAFIESNVDCVHLAQSHEDHADTEYRYVLDATGWLTVYECQDEWMQVYGSSIEDFLKSK